MENDKKTILAIDWGEKRLGIALSDDMRIMAHPYGIIENGETVYNDISELAGERNVGLIVIGLPLTLEGEEGDMADKVRKFGANLSPRIDNIPIKYFDERLTSGGAKAVLRDSGKTAKEGKKHLDAVAATLLLETYLELLQNQDNDSAADL